MYHSKIRQKIRHKRILHEVLLELTYRCNLDCFFCYNDRDARGVPLSLDQYVVLLDDLARMQVMFLTFSGGEPMVHPRFFDLGRAARERGFVVRVRTNGHTLRRAIAERLKKVVDPYMVEISLHGATGGTHDRQTRVAGSFDRLLGNVGVLRDLGVRQRLVCTPTAWNDHELEEMLVLADQLGVPLRFQGPVAPRDNGDTTPLAIQPSRAAWQRVEALLAARAAPGTASAEDGCQAAARVPERDHLCGIGRESVDVDPYGNVLACMHLRQSAGNLHDETIEQIWNDSPVFMQARELSENAARRFAGKALEQFGAPLYCPAIEENAAKRQGCSGNCAIGGCG